MKPFSFLSLCLLTTGTVRAAAPSAPPPVTTLPAVTLSGQAIDIGKQTGWRVVYFWSATCPCVRDCERLSLIPLAECYKGRVTFYAVESGHFDLAGDRKALIENAALHHLPYPVLLDPRHAVADVLHAVSTPQTYLVDPAGRIVFQGAPDDSWDYKNRTGQSGMTHAYLADALTQALAGRPVARPYVLNMGCGIDR